MQSLKNEEYSLLLKKLKKEKKSISYQDISNYLNENSIVQEINGIPYDRFRVARSLSSPKTDTNIINAIDSLFKKKK